MELYRTYSKQDRMKCHCIECDEKMDQVDFLKHLEEKQHGNDEKFMRCIGCMYTTKNKENFVLHLETERHIISKLIHEKMVRGDHYFEALFDVRMERGEFGDASIPEREKEDSDIDRVI